MIELEKRNQNLEKKVKKLKKKKKESKEEAAKLRGSTPVRHIADDHDASTSDVELLEEPNFGSSQSNLDEEQAVITLKVMSTATMLMMTLPRISDACMGQRRSAIVTR